MHVVLDRFAHALTGVGHGRRKEYARIARHPVEHVADLAHRPFAAGLTDTIATTVDHREDDVRTGILQRKAGAVGQLRIVLMTDEGRQQATTGAGRYDAVGECGPSLEPGPYPLARQVGHRAGA
jgi:hypothetical protein